jgi:hypothetical protein
VSTIPLWAVEEWNNLKQSPFLLSTLSLGAFVNIFSNKNIAYLLLHVVLLGHSIYVVFVDLTEAYIMNALYNILLYKSLSGVCRYFNDVAYLPCMYCLVKTGSSEGSVIPLDQDLHVCGNIWWLIIILLCSLNRFFLLEINEKLSQIGTMSYQSIIFLFLFISFFFFFCLLWWDFCPLLITYFA